MVLNRIVIVVLVVFQVSILAKSQGANAIEIKPGIYKIDSLVSVLACKKIAIIANRSSTIKNINLVDTILALKLKSASGVEIVKIFSPEHGFSGNIDAGSNVKNSGFKNIPVVSLYGSRKKPSANDLTGIEVIIFDLQDVGVRFYTYLSTLHYVMQACAENNIGLIILDRPNPNAHYIDGPVLTENYASFVGLHPVPVVYGMTIGEYALMVNGEGWLGNNLRCNLSVVKIEKYTHQSVFKLDSKPSPNLPNMLSVYLYPSLCFFEGTFMSEGRGTGAPFQMYGHPNFPSKSFSFIPKSIKGVSSHPKLENQLCYGVNLQGLNEDSVRLSGKINLAFVYNAYWLMGTPKNFFNEYFDLLAGTDKLRIGIQKGKTIQEIRNSWQADIENFKKIRIKYLLYPD